MVQNGITSELKLDRKRAESVLDDIYTNHNNYINSLNLETDIQGYRVDSGSIRYIMKENH